ncbi:GNAT family N-acetyltransferase [Paenibacillus silviterrae]|uniref:GNAT family N-acetyltransferase n=1 Tax=Paenibacillus silviterrae TaxID=3242194 RepID=UPI002543DF79|nr:GNAT family protein [Paenibacillus chinjuensis]
MNESDAPLYQQIRLTALKRSPEAFGSLYEKEAQFSMEMVKERIRPTENKFVLGAFDDRGSLGGIVTFVRETSHKMAHKGNIFGFYVLHECRGKGLGRRLLLELLSQAKAYDGLEQMNLTVVSDNHPAKRLYESLGFESYGVERRALKYNGQYYDEDLMVLWLYLGLISHVA